MFCRQCGAEVGNEDTFCTKCGFDPRMGQLRNKRKKNMLIRECIAPPTYTHVNSVFARWNADEKVYGVGKIISGIIMIIVGIAMYSSTSSVKNDMSMDTLRYYLDSDYQANTDMMGFLAAVLIIAGIILLILGLKGKKEYTYSNGLDVTLWNTQF
ncbi:MAG: zinc ribbon domain-containing protein [Lachnospira eligens]